MILAMIYKTGLSLLPPCQFLFTDKITLHSNLHRHHIGKISVLIPLLGITYRNDLSMLPTWQPLLPDKITVHNYWSIPI